MITKIELKNGTFKKVQDCYFYEGESVCFRTVKDIFVGSESSFMIPYLSFAQIPDRYEGQLKSILELFFGGRSAV